MEIFNAANKQIFGNNLAQSWIPANIFSANPDLEGVQIRVKTTGLSAELEEIINNVKLDRPQAELWQSQIYKEIK